MRTRRPDGTVSRDVPSYRRVMPYLMRRRGDAAVFFEQRLDVTPTLEFLKEFNSNGRSPRAGVFDVVVWAAVQTLARFPHLNRFVAGGRLYDRDGIWISYSAKRALVDGSPLVVIKRRFDPGTSLGDVGAILEEDVSATREGRVTGTDREVDTLVKGAGLPLRALLALERFADAFGLLPGRYIENDPMFASLFVANVGSFGMDAPFHHLYEYGSISTFCAMGRVTEQPHAIDGELVLRPTLPLRFTFDERVEDGLHAYMALERLGELVRDPAGSTTQPTPAGGGVSPSDGGSYGPIDRGPFGAP